MMHREQLKDKKRIVIKIGSSSLTHEGGALNLLRIEKLARVMTDLCNTGKEVILVSSGAIATGAGKMGFDQKPEDQVKQQALAAIGQVELINIYDKLFQEYNKTVAQVLLTKDGLDDPKRRNYAKNTLNELLRMGIIPIINENDTVSIDEIEFGDNDRLSALVSTLLDADLLILLSDIDGMFDSDPSKNASAEIISKVMHFDNNIEKYVYSNDSDFGTGGMASKIVAARYCVEHDVDMIITNGSDPSIIYQLLEGKDVGTLFVSRKTAENFVTK